MYEAFLECFLASMGGDHAGLDMWERVTARYNARYERLSL
jgi:hypothetical protein